MLQAHFNGVWSGFQLGEGTFTPGPAAHCAAGWVPVNIPLTTPSPNTGKTWSPGECTPVQTPLFYSQTAACVVQENGKCYDPQNKCYVNPDGTCGQLAPVQACPVGMYLWKGQCFPPAAQITELITTGKDAGLVKYLCTVQTDGTCKPEKFGTPEVTPGKDVVKSAGETYKSGGPIYPGAPGSAQDLAMQQACAAQRGMWNIAKKRCDRPASEETNYTPWVLGGLGVLGVLAFAFLRPREE